jgi:sulfatase modifying factor 1
MMNSRGVARAAVVVAAVCVALVSAASAAVNIETVPIGNPGNAGELSGSGAGGYGIDRICGAVAYDYNIGKYEVTAGQYTAFLNAVAKTDTYGLYNANMALANSTTQGCNIVQSGGPGSHNYSVASDWVNRPVNYVSWGDAARFANWMTHGQPTGAQNGSTTEDGAYYLNGATDNASLMAVTRKTVAQGGRYYIPVEDEWYKAAYHKNDGVTGNYFDYPTGSNSMPSNDLISPDPGNNANFYQNGYTIGSPYYRTSVGEFENSDSPYGTFDQGGNVWEWNSADVIGYYRGVRGGSFYSSGGHGGGDGYGLRATYRDYLDPVFESSNIGFRVSEVPEPATLSLLALGGLALMARRRGRK